MSVKQLPNGRWQVRVYLPGSTRKHQKFFTKRFKKEQSARKAESRLLVAVDEGNPRLLRRVINELRGRSEVGTFKELAELYMRDYVEVRNRDIYTKKLRVDTLVHHLGSVGLLYFDMADVNRFIRSRKKPKAYRDQKQFRVADITINRDLAVLKHIFRWAEEQGIILDNPIEKLRNLAEPPAPPALVPTLNIVNTVINKVPEAQRQVFIFMRETGCRRGEALGLQHEQVRRDEKRVLLTRTKAGRWRYLFLTEAALGAIDYIPQVCEWVWFNPKTMLPWHDLRKPWRSARKAAGYPWLKPKDLRRFYGIRLSEAEGVEMHHVQRALGHASVTTTEQHYAHYSDRSTEKRILRVLEGGKQ